MEPPAAHFIHYTQPTLGEGDVETNGWSYPNYLDFHQISMVIKVAKCVAFNVVSTKATNYIAAYRWEYIFSVNLAKQDGDHLNTSRICP